jgi:hypothetical protein
MYVLKNTGCVCNVEYRTMHVHCSDDRGQCTNKYRVQCMHLTYTTVNVCTMNMVHEHIEYSTFTDDRVQV